MNRKTALLIILSTLLGLMSSPVSAKEEAPKAPEQVVLDFLTWYLPVAFDKGSKVILDKRMDAYIESKTLAAWRKEEQSEGGFGAVPFVGQDYDEAWAKNFKVTKVENGESKADITVRYSAPEWTQNLKFSLVKSEAGWRIKGSESLP